MDLVERPGAWNLVRSDKYSVLYLVHQLASADRRRASLAISESRPAASGVNVGDGLTGLVVKILPVRKLFGQITSPSPSET